MTDYTIKTEQQEVPDKISGPILDLLERLEDLVYVIREDVDCLDARLQIVSKSTETSTSVANTFKESSTTSMVGAQIHNILTAVQGIRYKIASIDNRLEL